MWIHWQHAYLYFLNKYLPFPCISERVSECYFQFLFIVLKFCSILFWLTQLLTGRQLLNSLAPSVTFFRCFCIGSNRSFQQERASGRLCLLVSACLASENVHLPSSFTCVWVHICVQMLTHMCVSMESSSIILHIIHRNMISPLNLDFADAANLPGQLTALVLSLELHGSPCPLSNSVEDGRSRLQFPHLWNTLSTQTSPSPSPPCSPLCLPWILPPGQPSRSSQSFATVIRWSGQPINVLSLVIYLFPIRIFYFASLSLLFSYLDLTLLC